MGLILLAACAPTEAPEAGAVALLTRASLDLRGVRPSLEDLRAVQADPGAVEARVADYLADPRLAERVASLWAPVYLTRADTYDTSDADYAMSDEIGFLHAMGEEPLRLLGEVAVKDLPWTEIVRADWSMANEVLAEHAPTDYPAGETGWKRVHWLDRRPAAGVLSSNGLWWRYGTTQGNANRGRANAVSRILLCTDFLDRSVPVDPELNLVDEAAVADALRNSPTCVSCHYSLDPLGSYFWGFYVEFGDSPVDLSHYHPERELLWQSFGGGVAPGYYGQEADGLRGLGARIAADPRFVSCAVEQAFELLLQRPADLDDTDALTRHREAFLAGGLTMRSLLASIVASEDYRETYDVDPEAVPWKAVGIDQYTSQVADLTGFVFTAEGRDVLAQDAYGMRSMAGGGRAIYGTGVSVEHTPTTAVVQGRVAEAAAAFAVAEDRAGAGRLFTAIDFTETPEGDRAAMIAQIEALELRVLGRAARDPDATLALWEEVYALEEDTGAAWAAVLAVLLRDPEFLFY